MSIESSLLEALKRFNERYERCHLELLEEIQVSELKIKQLKYLEIIGSRSYLTFSQFAEELGVTKPSVTSIVNQLIRLQCVRKSQCSRGARKFYIELSAKGEKIVAFNSLKQKRLADKIVVALTETETEILTSLLNKIASA